MIEVDRVEGDTTLGEATLVQSELVLELHLILPFSDTCQPDKMV